MINVTDKIHEKVWLYGRGRIREQVKEEVTDQIGDFLRSFAVDLVWEVRKLIREVLND